jgi:hypothetical protein
VDEPVGTKLQGRTRRTEGAQAEGAFGDAAPAEGAMDDAAQAEGGRDEGALDWAIAPDAAMDQTATVYDAAADEAAADEARLRYRRRGVGRIDPDERIGPVLEPGEQLMAVRRSALLYRPETPEAGAASPLAVDVYVTSRRLVLMGPDTYAFDLAAVDEAVVSNESLLLVLCDGAGLVLEVNRPRLLRVEIAAARAAQR